MQHPSLQLKEYRVLAQRAATLKSQKQLNSLVETVFSNVVTLKNSFRQHTECHNSNDTKSIIDFYRQFKSDNPDILLRSLDSMLNKLKGQAEVRKDITSNLELHALFIAMLYSRLYDFENNFQTIRLAHALHFLTADMRKTLSIWLTDIDEALFQNLVSAVQTQLSVELIKLTPEVGQGEGQATQHYILIFCRLLQIFSKSNQLRRRIPHDLFQNSNIIQNFDPLMQVKLTMKGIARLNFVKFPFLFDLDYKSKLLELQSSTQQMQSLHRGIQSIQLGHLPMPDANGHYSIDSVLYLQFTINREKILDDSIAKIAQVKTGLKKPLKIAFQHEEGHDEGGVKKEYFQLLTKEIFNPNLAMFVPKNNNRFFWFNGDSLEAPIIFEFVGMLLGLSIYNSIQLDLHFPMLVYKKLLEDWGAPIDYFEQLKQIQPELYKGFKKILETKQSLSDLCMFFEVETDHFGVKTSHELKPGGSKIAISHQNKHQYVHLYCEWLLNKHVDKQFKAFRKGFYRVVTGQMIKVFYPEELQKIICGSQTLDFKGLEKTTEYEGFTPTTPIVRQLWEILHDMTDEDKRAFLFFVTGSDRAPIKGLAELCMVIQRQSPDTDKLPTAHTCTNVFLLPQYSSKHKLKEKLYLALKNNQGFGLI